MSENKFVSGFGVKIKVTVTNKFTLLRALLLSNQRMDQIWDKISSADEALKFLDYEGKKDYYSELSNEVRNISRYSSPDQTYFYNEYQYNSGMVYRTKIPAEPKQLIDNILMYCKAGPIRITLNEYDLIPYDFEQLSQTQQLAYILKTKFFAYNWLDDLKDINRRYWLFEVVGFCRTVLSLNLSLELHRTTVA